MRGVLLRAARAVLLAMLALQHFLTVPQGLIFGMFKPRGGDCAGYIYSQRSLKGRRLYLARAEDTACEVVAVYNALCRLKIAASFEKVRSAFFTSGALTLFFVGFFGGNPYSLKRVLGRFGVKCKKMRPEDVKKWCVLSFFNPGALSIHTVFCERRADGLYAYNLGCGVRRISAGERGEMIWCGGE